MRVLVTGAGGQLGRALLATQPAGAAVVGLTRDELDIRDRDALALALSEHQPDWVFNAAAYNAVDAAETDEAAAYAVNFRAVATLAELCRAQGSRLLHLSSDFVYDGRSHKPYSPADRAVPLSVYGKSKLAGEEAVTGTLGSAALIVRTAWVYSRDGRSFVRAMLDRMRAGESLRVVQDQVGTPTWVDPLALTLWAATRAELEGIHHWTPAGSASRYDLVVALQEDAIACGVLEQPVEVVPILSTELGMAAERPAHCVLDKSATWAALGATPPHWRVHLRAMLKGLTAADAQLGSAL